MDLIISKLNASLEAGVFDISTTADLYSLLRLTELYAYKMDVPLLEKYRNYLDGIDKYIQNENIAEIVNRERKSINTAQFFLIIVRKI